MKPLLIFASNYPVSIFFGGFSKKDKKMKNVSLMQCQNFLGIVENFRISFTTR
jgi:hypothetical protein